MLPFKKPVRGLLLSAIFLSVVSAYIYCMPCTAVSAQFKTMEPETIEVVVGKSVVINSARSIKRVSVGSPEIADFILLSPRELYITGKGVGSTNMILWSDKRAVTVYDIEVTHDVASLKRKLNDVMPEEKELKVIATGNSVALSGRISNTSSLAQAMALAKAYAPEGNVQNLMEVKGIHQVMLEVRVAEVSRTLIKRLGFNMHYTRGEDFGVGLLGGLTELVAPSDAELLTGPLGMVVSPSVNALFRFNKNGASWTGFIDALRDDGLLKVLAEPTLIVLSGQTGNFLAGGEFPVPVPQGLGTVAIEYRSFGVGLTFTPTVLSDRKINIKVQPEVSELDYSTAVQFSGFIVPGLTTRRASTMVELADGQSFAVAGLLRDTVRDASQKYPVLGDVPIIGALFRSREFQKGETELIIIVTPHLVKPLDMAQQTLPTDFYAEPTDSEFYLEGLMTGRGKGQQVGNKAEMDGEFGHEIAVSK